MAKQLTVKQVSSVLSNKEAFAMLIRLYEMAYGFDAEKFKAPQARKLKPTMVTAADACALCKETRNLEKAHIIPVHIYAKAEIVGELPDELRHAMYLCPTHHKAYDKYKLTTNEKRILQPGLDLYREVFISMLRNMEVINGCTRKAIEDLDKQLATAWKWWMVYGNR